MHRVIETELQGYTKDRAHLNGLGSTQVHENRAIYSADMSLCKQHVSWPLLPTLLTKSMNHNKQNDF